MTAQDSEGGPPQHPSLPWPPIGPPAQGAQPWAQPEAPAAPQPPTAEQQAAQGVPPQPQAQAPAQPASAPQAPQAAPAIPTKRLRTKGYEIHVPQPYAEGAPCPPELAVLGNERVEAEARKIANAAIAYAQEHHQPLTNEDLGRHVWNELRSFDLRARRGAQRRPADPVDAEMLEIAKERVTAYLRDVLRADPRQYDIPGNARIYIERNAAVLRQEAEARVRAKQPPQELGFQPVAKGGG